MCSNAVPFLLLFILQIVCTGNVLINFLVKQQCKLMVLPITLGCVCSVAIPDPAGYDQIVRPDPTQKVMKRIKNRRK